MVDKYKKESFSKVIKNSDNYVDACKNLNIGTSKGNRDTIKKYINLYSIDNSHFKDNKSNSVFRDKIETVDILVENSTYQTTHLKNRLYKEGLKQRKCELCGQGEMWEGKKMSLILDHINGVNNDNRIENLRIVCPNCNATLPTHCRGKK